MNISSEKSATLERREQIISSSSEKVSWSLWGQVNGFAESDRRQLCCSFSMSRGEVWRDVDEILKGRELMQGQSGGTQGALSP